MLKRYDVGSDFMRLSAEGEYVKHEDVAGEIAKVLAAGDALSNAVQRKRTAEANVSYVSELLDAAMEEGTEPPSEEQLEKVHSELEDAVTGHINALVAWCGLSKELKEEFNVSAG